MFNKDFVLIECIFCNPTDKLYIVSRKMPLKPHIQRFSTRAAIIQKHKSWDTTYRLPVIIDTTILFVFLVRGLTTPTPTRSGS